MSCRRRLILSGLLATEADRVADGVRRSAAMRERERRLSGEWAALLLTRA